MIAGPDRPIGLTCVDDAWTAVVWAPRASSLAVEFANGERVALDASGRGYFVGDLGRRPVGSRYLLDLDARRLADPASRVQPAGVAGPSALVDPATFTWHDGGYRPPPLQSFVLYELHVGTFRAAPDPTAPGGMAPGTFASAAVGLGELATLGVNAVEPMPIGAFPGERNWGYDGVFPYAPQASYGGPAGFASFVDEAHRVGLAVVLDVVYNHLGPEGSVLEAFGPYTTDHYRTPWGPAVNVDQAGSDEVRRYLFDNARMWFADYHVDALRLDAVHAIVDTSASPFLAELAEATKSWSRELGRPLVLIAESADNNPRLVRGTEQGGLGMDAQWSDDFHHALHVALTGERRGYLADYEGGDDLRRAVRDGFAYTGQYSAFRGRRHGAPPTGVAPARFVVSAQNHDQVGNRPDGARLASLVSADQLAAAAAVLLTSPHVPLLFMGEEYGERAPFCYFVDHAGAELREAVRRGRIAEFGGGEHPDPASPATFAASCLSGLEAAGEGGEALWRLYRDLIGLRAHEAIATDPAASTSCVVSDGRYELCRRGDTGALLLIANLHRNPTRAVAPRGRWRIARRGGQLGREPEGAPDHLHGGEAVMLDGAGFACYLGVPGDG